MLYDFACKEPLLISVVTAGISYRVRPKGGAVGYQLTAIKVATDTTGVSKIAHYRALRFSA